ncbi:MAG: HAD family hydrolase [Candidatus Hodarchaeota archaeon]
MSMKVEGLIFDFGFTLFEFKEVSLEKYFECYRKGLKKTLEKLRNTKILDNEAIIKRFSKLFKTKRALLFRQSIKTKIEYPTSHIFELIWEELNLENADENFFLELASIYHSYEEEEWIPFEKTKDTLERLSEFKNLKLAVLSNHPHHNTIINLLKRYNLLNFFDAVVTSAEFGKRKPDPDIFLYTIKKMGLNSPQSCIVCGDEPSDIVGGNRVGSTTILCKRMFKFPFEEEIKTQNYKKVNDISEILNFIE